MSMKNRLFAAIVFSFVLFFPHFATAQQVSVGGRGGLSIFSNQGSSAGLQFGPTIDYEFKKRMLIGSELNINTQGGTPIEWANYFKYLLDVSKSNITPYVDGGFSLWFVSGGPYFALRFGGGAYFPISNNMVIPADIQLGPVFTSGSSTFYFAMTSGIRYNLPSK